MSEVTLILNAIEQGDHRAVDELLPVVYKELRCLAAQKLAQERPGQTLQATALVHEAYIRLLGAKEQKWDGSGHFFKAAAEAMRRILVENARRKQNSKHGGDRQRVSLTGADVAVEGPCDDLIALDDALNKLAGEEAAIAELVKLRYFAGLTLEQAAEVSEISLRTAGRYWAYGRVRLLKEISQDGKKS